MSDTVKLIIEIPKELSERICQASSVPDMQGIDIVNAINSIKNGTPFDSNSDRAEVQAYFAGQTYGWEQGRKALIDDVKAEIGKAYEDITMYSCDEQVSCFASRAFEILDNIGKGDKEC